MDADKYIGWWFNEETTEDFNIVVKDLAVIFMQPDEFDTYYYKYLDYASEIFGMHPDDLHEIVSLRIYLEQEDAVEMS